MFNKIYFAWGRETVSLRTILYSFPSFKIICIKHLFYWFTYIAFILFSKVPSIFFSTFYCTFPFWKSKKTQKIVFKYEKVVQETSLVVKNIKNNLNVYYHLQWIHSYNCIYILSYSFIHIHFISLQMILYQTHVFESFNTHQ